MPASSLAIVFPSFWGRPEAQGARLEDFFYDHPTPIDRDGTLPACIESMRVLGDESAPILAVCGASIPELDAPCERRMREILSRCCGNRPWFLLGVTGMTRLHRFLKDKGEARLLPVFELKGYSPLRNQCLLMAQLLDIDIAYSIDDDVLFTDPKTLTKIRDSIGTRFDGRPIRALCGAYRTPSGDILLSLKKSAWGSAWDTLVPMNEAFRRVILEGPRYKSVGFAIMGNIAVHREFYTKVPLDPPMRRGEDSDWVFNAHLLGEEFIWDRELEVMHAPPPRPHPTWRAMREDILRFGYSRAKLRSALKNPKVAKIDRALYEPFPAAFWNDDLEERAAAASTLMAIEYLVDGKPEDARQALHNVFIARRQIEPVEDPVESYLWFQSVWVAAMHFVAGHRAALRDTLFGY
jgi:hypothetical protein